MNDEETPQHARGGAMYVPTDEQRRMVKVMSGFGIPQTDIANQLGVDAKTLRKHFREELDRGMTEANMRVAQSLYNMATTGGSVAAAIFWMKARAGWREKHEVVVIEAVPEYISPEEQDEIIARIKRGLAELERSPWTPAITIEPSDGSPPPDPPCSPPTNDR